MPTKHDLEKKISQLEATNRRLAATVEAIAAPSPVPGFVAFPIPAAHRLIVERWAATHFDPFEHADCHGYFDGLRYGVVDVSRLFRHALPMPLADDVFLMIRYGCTDREGTAVDSVFYAIKYPARDFAAAQAAADLAAAETEADRRFDTPEPTDLERAWSAELA